ncbi:hypothetical protein DFH07DRAFT_780622 [Mycena maculata]|uniref:CxC2-like cysteine cluster KDZ transposase-associated domain-containing protein n=1 Tax=Mycena maculata TaxID=230809 RepID=A0AAD7I247_9AGAR|nr:hypothetical protein DFH07DRAFT_780622 [Mycena maculata]
MILDISGSPDSAAVIYRKFKVNAIQPFATFMSSTLHLLHPSSRSKLCFGREFPKILSSALLPLRKREVKKAKESTKVGLEPTVSASKLRNHVVGKQRSNHFATRPYLEKEWAGQYWTEATLCGTCPDSRGLTGVGLVYQLRHHSFPCAFPGPLRSMAVINVNGIFSLDIQYCNCEKAEHEDRNPLTQLLGNVWYPASTIDPGTCATFQVLEFFRLLQVMGNITAHNFVGPLQGVRQDELTICLAPVCYPSGERLGGRRSGEDKDPSLGPGLGYFVEPSGYKEHLQTYIAEKDVSSCIAFAALLQKETHLTTGLQVSGVGGCDLQKGERYANMDYIFLSALAGVAVLMLEISYNISCQWKVHLPERAKKITASTLITTNLEDFDIQYALPVWHAVAHEVTCQTQNSLSFAVGVGCMDGEGIERTWAVLNPIGFSTKEMGEGNRQDTIENKVDHLNWEKNIGQGDALSQKLIVVIAECNKQVQNFRDVNHTLQRELQREWKGRVTAWLADRSQPNPYYLAGGKDDMGCATGGPSKAAVLAKLEAAEGRTPLSSAKTTMSAFLKGGLQLEEAR